MSQEIESVLHTIRRQTPSRASFEGTLRRIHHEKEAICRPIPGMNREIETVWELLPSMNNEKDPLYGLIQVLNHAKEALLSIRPRTLTEKR